MYICGIHFQNVIYVTYVIHFINVFYAIQGLHFVNVFYAICQISLVKRGVMSFLSLVDNDRGRDRMVVFTFPMQSLHTTPKVGGWIPLMRRCTTFAGLPVA